jgi:hypothetical protein
MLFSTAVSVQPRKWQDNDFYCFFVGGGLWGLSLQGNSCRAALMLAIYLPFAICLTLAVCFAQLPQPCWPCMMLLWESWVHGNKTKSFPAERNWLSLLFFFLCNYAHTDAKAIMPTPHTTHAAHTCSHLGGGAAETSSSLHLLFPKMAQAAACNSVEGGDENNNNKMIFLVMH